MTRYTRLTCLWIATLLAGCRPPASTPEVFRIEADSFFTRIQTLALTPVMVMDDVAAPEGALTYIDTLIDATVRRLGFSAIPAVAYQEIWSRINEEGGGFYDPYTGVRDELRYQDAVDRLRSELTERFDPDGILFPEIWIVEAETPFGRAQWDGASQEVGGGTGGYVLALSLVVVIQDMNDTDLYVHAGGIQVIERWSAAQGGWEPIPPDLLFGDIDRIVGAVSTALKPLGGRDAAVPDTGYGDQATRR